MRLFVLPAAFSLLLGCSGGTEPQPAFIYDACFTIDDCVEALLLAARSKKAEGRVVNLGGNEKVSLEALADLLVRQNGSGRYVTREYPEERKKIDIGDYYSDFQLAGELLDWEPRVPLAAALDKILTFYKQHLKAYL